MSEKSAFEAFARMEERIEKNERQLKASIEIEEEFTGDTPRAGLQAAREGRRRRTASTCSCSRSSRRWACSLPDRPAEESARRRQRDEETVHAEIEDITSEKKEPLSG